MVDTKCVFNSETIANSDRGISKNKNFKEDDLRNSIGHRFSKDFSDIRSEISEGRRIDLDEDGENYFEYHNKSKPYKLTIS